MSDNPTLAVRGLSKRFRMAASRGSASQYVQAVDDVSFDIAKGTTFALVGESGSGKTTTGRLVAGLETPDSGHIFLEGRETSQLSRSEQRAARHDLQFVYQDPYASLDPRQSIGKTLEEPLVIQGTRNKAQRRESVRAIMEAISLPAEYLWKFPNELSGGQRQRISIARAIIASPKIVILDEPVSALDVSVQAQILNLLKDLQGRTGVTYLLITHDMRVVRFMADSVGVLNRGKLVESGSASDVLAHPKHDYTRALIAAVPRLVRRQKMQRRSSENPRPR